MITNFIQSRNIKGKYKKDITSFDQAARILILSIYKSGCNNLNVGNQGIFYQLVASKFMPKIN